MTRLSLYCCIVTLFAVFASTLTTSVNAAPDKDYGRIEIVRDQWGTPHVFSDTDEGALFGLGYASAEDRCFQMNYFLRTMQGRLAEAVGDIKTAKGKSALESDRYMRIIGYYRHAKTVAGNLDPATQALLRAHSEGVNQYLDDYKGDLHYLFAEFDFQPEPWTPADTIVMWYHAAKWFSKDGTKDKIQLDFKTNPYPNRAKGDDDAAVVKREDVSQEWIDEVNAYMVEHGLRPQEGADKEEPPKMSHAWVIGGTKTTTGAAVLISDPQTPVWNPSFLYEFHIKGATFNTRGAGFAGSPIQLLGFNENVAWGMSALGADQSDLFIYKKDKNHPNQYEYDGEWRDMNVWEETILVKDGDAETIELRETHHGPVVTSLVKKMPKGYEGAVRIVPLCEPDRDSLQAMFGMMRSKNVKEFTEALPDWRFPSGNCIFGDSNGDIGYWSLGALPVRSAKAVWWGKAAHDGSKSECEWQGMVPYDLLPHCINPKRGYLVTANHRTIQSFYQLMMGTNTGSYGDTERGLRIKEQIVEHLAKNDKFTPEEVLAIQYDGVNVLKRELVRLGLHFRDADKESLPEPVLKALDYLEDWFNAGADTFTDVKGTDLVNNMQFQFRRGSAFGLAEIYGGGGGGVSNCATAISKRFANDPKAKGTEAEKNFTIYVLGGAWNRMEDKYGADPDRWHELYLAGLTDGVLGYYRNLEGFPSLDKRYDVKLPQLTVVDGSTIWSQKSQAYTQYVPLHDTDAATSINPIGPAERPGSPYRFSTYGDWAKGQLNPAPLTREGVEKIAAERKLLSAPAPLKKAKRKDGGFSIQPSRGGRGGRGGHGGR